MKHFSYPDIKQFRSAIHNITHVTRFIGTTTAGDAIYDETIPLPKVSYRGTIKLHGTNAGVAKNLITGELSVQSRENIITPQKDNAGFARFVENADFNSVFDMIPSLICAPDINNQEESDAVIIYGEWCGRGIQKNVAISNLDKMFVIFSIKYAGNWLSDEIVRKVSNPAKRIFNILDFPVHDIVIDFSNPEIASQELQAQCIEVEKECPVGKAFGASGIGEGLVYKPLEAKYSDSKFWFKVKGEKHSVVKTKTLAPVDVEKASSINEFVDKVVVENRLNQGIEVIKRTSGVNYISNEHIGPFIKWIIADIAKEESDTLAISGLTIKDVSGEISKKAKEFLFKNFLNK